MPIFSSLPESTFILSRKRQLIQVLGAPSVTTSAGVNGYTWYTFDGTNGTAISRDIYFSGEGYVDILLCAGGGGGGAVSSFGANRAGGGGGGGGNTIIKNLYVSNCTATVNVGGGAVASSGNGLDGYDSSLTGTFTGSFYVYGGGGGGYASAGGPNSGNAGGFGGGSGWRGNSASSGHSSVLGGFVSTDVSSPTMPFDSIENTYNSNYAYGSRSYASGTLSTSSVYGGGGGGDTDSSSSSVVNGYAGRTFTAGTWGTDAITISMGGDGGRVVGSTPTAGASGTGYGAGGGGRARQSTITTSLTGNAGTSGVVIIRVNNSGKPSV